MGFAAAGSADQNEIGALADPAVAGADRHDMGLGDHRHGLELEAVEGLAREQAGGQPSLSARSAKLPQPCLMAGRRNSLRMSVSRVRSMSLARLSRVMPLLRCR